MAKRKESALAGPIQGAQIGAFSEKSGYTPPEFKTISAAAHPKKGAKKRLPEPVFLNEDKDFSIDDLFMTNS